MFNNSFPYQVQGYGYNYMPQQIPQMQQQCHNNGATLQQPYTEQPISNIEYVNGIEGAKALILPPNSTKLVLDSDSKQFFIKTTDQTGRPSIKTYSYTDIESETKQNVVTDNFVTMDQFSSLFDDFKSLKTEFNKFKSQKKGE